MCSNMFFLCYVVLRDDVETNIWKKKHLFRETMPNMCFFLGCSTAQLTKQKHWKNPIQQSSLSSGIGLKHVGIGKQVNNKELNTINLDQKKRKQPSRPMKQSIIIELPAGFTYYQRLCEYVNCSLCGGCQMAVCFDDMKTITVDE